MDNPIEFVAGLLIGAFVGSLFTLLLWIRSKTMKRDTESKLLEDEAKEIERGLTDRN
jgi:gas vesicle protein